MKLLLHTCCGPCLAGVYAALDEEHVEFTSYFFNPNIHPQAEFEKRVDAFLRYTSQMKVKKIMNDMYGREIFEKEVLSAGGDRCSNCYRVRLEDTAVHAAKNGFDAFSTTLLISPYQKHERIRAIGEELAVKHSVRFFYRDFRPFYPQSRMIAREMGLFRQKYCGCFLSEAEVGQKERARLEQIHR